MKKSKSLYCSICNQEVNGYRGLASHLRKTHNLSNKEYYDKFLKSKNEGVCLKCGYETTFYRLSKGYLKYCSVRCMRNTKEVIEKSISSMKTTRISNGTYATHNGLPLFEFYALKIGWAEDVRRDPNNSLILNVRCKKCNDWFIPGPVETRTRLNVLNGKVKGECNFYCSDSCKQSCSIFNRSMFQVDHPLRTSYNRTYQNEWSQMVKERDGYTCQRCGNPGNIAHHIKPVKTHPHLQADLDNGICVCTTCDKEYFHQLDGCKTGELANLVC